MLSDKTWKRIDKLAHALQPAAVAWRRDVHKHAESGWTEFRTASRIARRARRPDRLTPERERALLAEQDRLESRIQEYIN